MVVSVAAGNQFSQFFAALLYSQASLSFPVTKGGGKLKNRNKKLNKT
jgi:hypothetical protein